MKTATTNLPDVQLFGAFDRDVVLSVPAGGGRSITRAGVYLALVLAVLTVTNGLSVGPIQPPADLHEILSLNRAINSSQCGTSTLMSGRLSPAVYVAAHPDLMQRKLAEVLTSMSGSVAAYCQTLNTPYVDEENGLMILMRTVLYIRPGSSLADLARLLTFIRFAAIFALAFVLLWTGASLGMTAWLIVIGSAVLLTVGIHMTMYPFLMVLPLAGAAFYTAALGWHRWRPGLWPASVIAVAAGLLSALVANLRFSYLMIYLAMFGVWVFEVLRHQAGPGRGIARVRLGVALPLAFVAGFLTFNAVVIRPLIPPPSADVPNYVHHATAHTLVMGLAQPDNDFARRHGIAWKDEAAFALAKRVNPNVEYLRPGYEEALFTYYGRLWRRFPRDMFALYLGKITATAVGIVGPAVYVLRLPVPVPDAWTQWLDARLNGWIYFLLAFAWTGLAGWQYWRTGSLRMFGLGLASLAAVMVLVEAAVIVPHFGGKYQNYLLFFFGGLMPVMSIQMALDVAARRGWLSRLGRMVALHGR